MWDSYKKKTCVLDFALLIIDQPHLEVYSKFIEWAYGRRGIYFLKLRFFKINQEELIVLIHLFFHMYIQFIDISTHYLL